MPGLNRNENPFAFVGFKKSLIGGIVAGSIAIISQILIGRVYHGWEAKRLFDAVTTSSRYLDSAAAGGSSTIIALMLTMLSMGRNKKIKVESEFFKRIKTITLFSTIALISAVIQLQIFSMPLTEAKNADGNIFNYLYYFMIVYVAFIAGLMVSIILMLMDAVNTLIDTSKRD